jgi:hypothetical protein
MCPEGARSQNPHNCKQCAGLAYGGGHPCTASSWLIWRSRTTALLHVVLRQLACEDWGSGTSRIDPARSHEGGGLGIGGHILHFAVAEGTVQAGTCEVGGARHFHRG